MAIQRFSSRTEKLDTEFLAESLKGAIKYFRIAGYFRSSIFELVGEEIAKIPEVKIICNSELDLADFQVATGRNTALKERWNEVDVEAGSTSKKGTLSNFGSAFYNRVMSKFVWYLETVYFCMVRQALFITTMAVASLLLDR